MENNRFAQWMTRSITIKILVVVFLMLLLLVPASMVRSIINERQSMNQQATMEVSQKWAQRQMIHGPILTIPYQVRYMVDTKERFTEKQFHILPDQLKINGDVTPKELSRGIYKVIVYNSTLSISGSFNALPDIPESNVSAIHWDKAFLTLGISDLRGIEDNITFDFNDQKIEVEPSSRVSAIIPSGVTLPIDLSTYASEKRNELDFSTQLFLKGSQNLSFVPVGATTEVAISSSWADPSFVGNFLPRNRSIEKDGFTADWKVLQLNRSFPQSFIGDQHGGTMASSQFGVDFIIALDDYQKSIRSVKYAGMTIALTFLIFFLVEILNKRKIHPLQYVLVGLALVLFYIMLVAIGEHMHFNWAFLVSAGSIVAMVSLYSLSIFSERKHTFLLTLCLIAVYVFLFTTLQLRDYALLIGCIGLFITLSLTMYFTRKIDWYDTENDG